MLTKDQEKFIAEQLCEPIVQKMRDKVPGMITDLAKALPSGLQNNSDVKICLDFSARPHPESPLPNLPFSQFRISVAVEFDPPDLEDIAMREGGVITSSPGYPEDDDEDEEEN